MDFDFGTFNAFDDEPDGLEGEGPAVARIVGRMVRVDPIGDDAAEVLLWLAVEDDGYPEGEYRTRYQAIKIRTLPSRLWQLTDGCEVVARCRFHRGQVHLIEFESIAECDAPLPELRLPQRRTEIGTAADSRLPTMDQLDKLSREGEWGKLNHSVFRFQVPVHVTFSPKYRRQCLLGHEVEAQALLRHVITGEGVEIVACAVENGDHVHLVLRHAGAGTPPTWCWSKFVGRIKALTSRLFKQFDADFEWQVGYALTAVHGGRQGAEQALAAVRAYVENQGVQSSLAT